MYASASPTATTLVDLTTREFFLRMIDELVHVALHRPVAAGRVRVEPTARSHGDLGRLLHRLHREISGRLDNDRPLAPDPGDDRGPSFVLMAPTGLAFLAPATRPASQRLLPALLGLPLVARGVLEIIRFDRASTWRSIS
jgi:hypothetical protein